MRKLTLLILIYFSVAYLFAQTSTISGSVTGSNGLILSNVTVVFESQKTGVATNAKGKYSLTVEPGEHAIVFSCVGYQTFRQAVSVSPGANVELHIKLAEAVTDLPEIVISSASMTGGDEGIREIPGSAYYISPKQIQKFNYTDINRTLRTIPGVNIQEEEGFGLRPNIGLRGTGVDRSSKITIMEDGVLMAPAPYASPAAYYFPTVGRMQSVEVLKGSSQIKYGPYTTGGAINFISAQIPEKLSGKLMMNYGSFNSSVVHALVGDSYEHVGFVAETFQYGSDGFKQLDNKGNTGFKKEDYLVKLRLNTGDKAAVYQSLTFKAAYAKENSNETYLGLTADDFEATPYRRYAASQFDNMQTEHTQFSARHVAQFNKNVSLTTTVYRNDFIRNWYKLDKVSDSTGTSYAITDILDTPENYNDAYAIITGVSSTTKDALQVKANNRSYYGQGVESIFNYFKDKGAFYQSLTAGIRYHEDQMDRFQWTDKYAMYNGTMMQTVAGVPGTESNYIVDAAALAAYAQYKFRYNKISVIPGIRFENITVSEINYGKTDPERTGADLTETENIFNVFIPGVGVDYKFSEFINAFAGVHKGFAPAGPTDGALPEESINYELGTRFYKSAIHAQAIIFYNDYQNLLGADLAASGGVGSSELYNGGAATAYGAELLVSTNLLYQSSNNYALPFIISYTYTNAYFNSSFESDFEDWGTVEDGDELPYLAHNQLFVQLSLEHEMFSINANTKFVSDMRASAGQGSIPVEELIPSHTTIDFSAAWHINTFLSICGSITNLTDNVYVAALRPAGYRPGMPRSFNVGIKTYFR